MTDYTDKIWLKSYPEDVAETIDATPYKSLVDLYEESLNKFSNRVAFENLGAELTYKQVNDYVTATAAWLQSHFEQRARIAIMSPNSLYYPILVQSIHSAGMVVVNMNPLLTPRELSHILTDSQASALFIWDGSAHLLNNLKKEDFSLQTIIVLSLADFFPFFKKNIAQFVLKRIKKIIPDYNLMHFNTRHFKDVLAFEAPKSQPAQLTHDDLAFLQYTGGTTGLSKGVMLTHGNMLSNILQAESYLPPELKENQAKNVITALPLYHIFALTANFFTMLKLGMRNVLITNPRDLPTFIKTMQKNPPEVITGVNTLFHALAYHSDIKKIDFSGLVLALGGGMAVQRATAEKWKSITGTFILEAYGLTETSPAVTINPHTQKDFNGSIGLPIPSTIVHIINDQEREVPIGKEGELAIEGPQVMKGYWNNEDATQKAFTKQGWFKTGDMGTMNEEGFIYLLDRIKDMIIVSGFNVYPTEVEQVVNELDGILECGCVGIDDVISGETIKVFVVKEPKKEVTKEQILKHCSKNLTKYKVPKTIEFVDNLPKTNVGKVLRRTLRDE